MHSAMNVNVLTALRGSCCPGTEESVRTQGSLHSECLKGQLLSGHGYRGGRAGAHSDLPLVRCCKNASQHGYNSFVSHTCIVPHIMSAI